jgi:hypothetical protein
LVELDEEHQPWDGSVHQLGDGRDEVVPAPHEARAWSTAAMTWTS